MNKIFGLLFGICLVIAAYWAYPEFNEKVPEGTHVAQEPESMESVHEENVQTPVAPVVIPAPEITTDETDYPAEVIQKEPEVSVRAENTDFKNWQVIWTPFRTRGSAMGFASRISQVTGLEMDVRNIKTGQFQVAFAYEDNQERQERLQLIEDQICLRLIKGDGI